MEGFLGDGGVLMSGRKKMKVRGWDVFKGGGGEGGGRTVSSRGGKWENVGSFVCACVFVYR